MGDRIGFIGLGTMGMPMVTNLARAGVELVVHDVSPAATQSARAIKGVQALESPRAVGAQSDVVFTCLPNDDVVLEVYLGPGGIGAGGKPGLITCDCSTVSPEATLEINRGRAQGHLPHGHAHARVAAPGRLR